MKNLPDMNKGHVHRLGNVIMSQAHESKMAASLFELTQIFSKQN